MNALTFYIILFSVYATCILLMFLYLRYKGFFKSGIILLIIMFLIGVGLFIKRRSCFRFFRNTYTQISISTSCNCKTTASALALKKDNYTHFHRPLAIKTSQNRYIKNNALLEKFIQKKYLVPIEENNGFYIQKLHNSSKHLTPLAYKRLLELGNLFRTKLNEPTEKKSYFVISSVTRTQSQQEEIIKSNPKTATRGLSTHSFGVSFDIRCTKAKRTCDPSINALKQALNQMQKEGKILLCPESSCIHVTVVK